MTNSDGEGSGIEFTGERAGQAQKLRELHKTKKLDHGEQKYEQLLDMIKEEFINVTDVNGEYNPGLAALKLGRKKYCDDPDVAKNFFDKPDYHKQASKLFQASSRLFRAFSRI